MAVFNFTPILFPSATKIYSELSDDLTRRERQAIIDQEGDIYSPSTYYGLADLALSYSQKVRDENQRRDLYNKSLYYYQKALDTEKKRKKDIDAGDLKYLIEEDLRELSFDIPNNPLVFADQAAEAYDRAISGAGDWQGLVSLINDLEGVYVDTTSLRNVLTDFIEERDKYVDIRDSFYTGDLTRLENYVVNYTPLLNGKIGAMKIMRRTDANTGVRSNLKYTLDEAGNPRIISEETGNGLPIYFKDPNFVDNQTGQKFLNFGNLAGNNKLVYDTFRTQYRSEFTHLLDVNEIRHEPFHSIPVGYFAKDTKGKLYYVNPDRTLSPIADDYSFRKLGGTEDKVFEMTKTDELNTKMGAIGPRIKFHTSPKLQQYQKEAIWAEYEAEKAKKEAGLLGVMFRPFGYRPAVPRAPYEERIRAVEEHFAPPPGIKPPTEKEAVEERTEKIIKAEEHKPKLKMTPGGGVIYE